MRQNTEKKYEAKQKNMYEVKKRKKLRSTTRQ